MTHQSTLWGDLEAALPYLSERDQEVAASLIDSREAYGTWTDRQARFVMVLIQRAQERRTPAQTTDLGGDLSGVLELFDSVDLKRPALYLRDPDSGDRFRISKAPAAGRNAGSLYVKAANRGQEGGTTYLGKVSPEGVFTPSREAPEAGRRVEASLRRFVADPVEAVLAYGTTTGECCLCGAELTNAESKARGIGPVCAEKWGF